MFDKPLSNLGVASRVMFRDVKGFAQFISVERGLMLFMISVGAVFLTAETLAWSSALYLGVTVFCIWSAVDAINNVCDVDLDVLSDPSRARFTKKLGKLGLFVVAVFTVGSFALGAITMIPFVVLFVALGLLFGVLYSVPPFRLRKTAYKPIVNFTVGAVPVLIVAAFFDVFSLNVVSLVLLIGVTTAVNSLWEDLADYASDFHSGSRTVPIIFGFRKGLFLTIIMGYAMIPMMVFVGLLFQLGWIYYASLLGLAIFVSLRLVQKRVTLFQSKEGDATKLHKLGTVLAKDFVIIAIVFTLSLMLSSLMKISPVFF
ncbi:MAG: UbiA family prenyltransferase [Candidatus Bathyarchaeota archaeon]|nr:UbiA family prenyltransferase [Candidatus Bathyarchaeota archaeon]